MAMRLLRADQHRRMTWKNGSGETIEVAVHPPGADLATFDWRVSMAKVASDGPFSVFEDVDRTLALLEGEGLHLAIAGLGDRHVTIDTAPLAFPADAPTDARLVDGPITDLNVMTRRQRCRHRVVRRSVEVSISVSLAHDWTLLMPMGECRLSDGLSQASLRLGDVVVSERSPGAMTVLTHAPTLVYVVEIDEVG